VPPTTKLSKQILLGAFLIALCAPTLGLAVGVGTSDIKFFEARAPFPDRPQTLLAVAQLPNKVRYYVNTHFSFRVPLMALYAQLKVGIFGVSGSDAVTLGKQGWLFFTGDQIIHDYRCDLPLTDQELARWRDHLIHRRDWLQRRGIPYVFVIAPNTGTIYPEYLPDTLHRFGSRSRLEQLTSYVEQHTDFRPVELRAALGLAKPRGRLYYQTDSHWNQLGGFVAYEEIAARLHSLLPAWRSRTVDDFDRVPTADWAGDLSYMLGAPSLFRETRIDLVPRRPTDVRSDGSPLPTNESPGNWSIRPIVVRESAGGEIPRAVVLRDSYFGAPAQFLSSHFGRMVMLWTNELNPKVIEEERPNVVIEEIVERSLMFPLLDEPPLP
jgi:alginate O-acetyltransferase complex protein AlgJ